MCWRANSLGEIIKYTNSPGSTQGKIINNSNLHDIYGFQSKCDLFIGLFFPPSLPLSLSRPERRGMELRIISITDILYSSASSEKARLLELATLHRQNPLERYKLYTHTHMPAHTKIGKALGVCSHDTHRRLCAQKD